MGILVKSAAEMVVGEADETARRLLSTALKVGEPSAFLYMSIGEGGGESYDLIVVGPLSVDQFSLGGKERVELGGTAAYTSLMAAKLGAKVGIVSTAGRKVKTEGEEGLSILEGSGVDMHLIWRGETLRFENSYSEEGVRFQSVEGATSEIGYKDIPDRFLNSHSRCFHFGPLLNGVALDAISGVTAKVDEALISLDPQGYLREVRPNGAIDVVGDWPKRDETLDLIQVLKLNAEEAGKITQKSGLRQMAGALHDMGPDIVLITRGQEGSALYSEERFSLIPSRKAADRDPTGAGDVYAGAFLVEYMLTRNAERSARFASVASSLAVEGIGLKGIPGKEAVENQLDEYKAQNPSEFEGRAERRIQRR